MRHSEISAADDSYRSAEESFLALCESDTEIDEEAAEAAYQEIESSAARSDAAFYAKR